MAREDEMDWEVDDEDDSRAADIASDGEYTCDHCGETIVVPLDVAAGRNQAYVEDCPVCCCPHLIHVEVDEDGIRVWAEPE